MQVLVDAAQRYDRAYLVTFQYSNEACPLFARWSDRPERIPQRSDYKYKYQYDKAMKYFHGERPTKGMEAALRKQYVFADSRYESRRTTETVQTIRYHGKEYEVAASLDCADISRVLKQFRRKWEYHHPDDPLNFKYHCIGEYGPQTARPHYHGIFFGLTPQQMECFRQTWQKNYGYCDVEEIERSVKSFTNSCQYVADYLNKGAFEPDCVQRKVCQRGRIQCSTGLALLTARELAYYRGEDLGIGLHDTHYSDEDLERVWKRLKRTIGDKQYKLSNKYKKLCFYEKKKIRPWEKWNETEYVALIPTPLQDALARYVQLRIVSDFEAELEQVALEPSGKIGYAALAQIKESERLSTEARRRDAKRRLQRIVSKSRF